MVFWFWDNSKIFWHNISAVFYQFNIKLETDNSQGDNALEDASFVPFSNLDRPPRIKIG